MRHLTVTLIFFLSAVARGQLSIDDAMARLREKEASRAASTRPSTPASQPTTRAAWRPRTIVFVIDARGRALSAFSKAREELIRAVNRLDQKQLFNAVVLQGDSPVLFRKSLTPATESAKSDFWALVDALVPRSSGDVGKAMRLAAAQRPDLIWIATVTDFAEAKTRPDIGGALMGYRGRVSIAVFDDSPSNADEIEYLRKLAAAHRGVCIDADGKELQPPKLVIAPPSPPRPAPPKPDTRPSIFDEH